MAGGLGLEPRLTESESAVLPLDDPPAGLTVHAAGAANGDGGHATAGAGGQGGRWSGLQGRAVYSPLPVDCGL